jgi:DNA-binding transcriptional ArsR family regulator
LSVVIELFVSRPRDLLAVRFATSPVWETLQAVRTLAHQTGSSARRPWERTGATVASQLDLEALLALNPRAGYVPDFLTPPPGAAAPRFRDQLAAIRRTPLEQVERELARSRTNPIRPDQRATVESLLADPAAALAALTDLIELAWRTLVAPHWPRIRALLSADIAFRSRQLADRGLRHVIDQLHQSIRWTGSSISVDVPGVAKLDLGERGLILMPSAYVRPGVVVVTDEPWQPTIVYPARGIGRLWEGRARSAKTLARLLGSTRATILASLETAASTTNLAASLGLSPSGVSRHLTALRDAGLLATTRYGHELRYVRTPLGTAVVRASAPEEPARRTG